MEKRFAPVENLPFSVIVLGEENKILYRNRMARGLLLPPTGMMRFFVQEKEKVSKEGIFSAVLDLRRYFIAVIAKRYGKSELRHIFFFEDFGLIGLPVSEYLLEECHKLLKEGEEKILACAEKEHSSSTLVSYCKRLSVRTRRFREERAAYFRMRAARNRNPMEEATCSLSGFFSFFSPALKEAGFSTTLSLDHDLKIMIHPDFLAEILLNSLQFVSLFEGERNVELQGEKEEKTCCLTLRFFDREELFELFGKYLLKENKKNSASRFAAFSPLFAAALLCDGEGFDFSLEKKGEMCQITLRVPLAEHVQESFLSAKDKEYSRILSDMVKEFFGQ